MNVAKCRTTQSNRCRNIRKSALHQYHICSIYRNICSCSDRNSHVCSCQCRSIIDTVSDHGYFSLILQSADHFFFSFRQYPCDNFVHSSLRSDGTGCLFIVTCKHDHPDSHILQFLHCLGTVFFDHICNCDHPQKSSVSGKE